MKLPNQERHIINNYELKKNVFRLINLFTGFSGILDDSQGYIKDFKTSKLFSDYSYFFEEEFSKLILEIAINARVLDDSIKKYNGKKDLNIFNGIEMLGIMDEDAIYSPREAINKIIHADHVSHDIRFDDVNPYYMPSLQIIGNKGKNQWVGEIFLLPFCKVLYDFACENDLPK